MDEVVLKKKWVGFFFFLLKRKDQFYIFFRDHFINLLHIRNQTHMYVFQVQKVEGLHFNSKVPICEWQQCILQAV